MNQVLIFSFSSRNTVSSATTLILDETRSDYNVQKALLDLIYNQAIIIGASDNIKNVIEADNFEFDKTYLYVLDSMSSENEQYLRDKLYLRKCDHCGRWVTSQNSTWNGSQRLCDTCISEQAMQARSQRKAPVKSYHATSSNNILLTSPNDPSDISLDNLGTTATYGFEMEQESNTRIVDSNGEIKLGETLYTLNHKNRRQNNFMRFETDGSLTRNYSFEAISNTMTENNLLENILIYSKAMVENALLNNIDDTNSNTGFHIHTGKQNWGDTPLEQAENVIKFLYFMKIYENDFFTISGRASREAMGYCHFFSENTLEIYHNKIQDMKTNGLNHSDPFWFMSDSHHYCLINSGHTIEIRIFKSCATDGERFIHTMKLIVGLIKGMRNTKWKDLYKLSKSLKYVDKETLNYWRKKGVFMKTYADQKAGEDF